MIETGKACVERGIMQFSYFALNLILVLLAILSLTERAFASCPNRKPKREAVYVATEESEPGML